MTGTRYVIRGHHPVRSVLLAVLAVGLGGVACVAAYWQGAGSSADELRALREEAADQRLRIDALDHANRDLREHLSLAERSSQVDKEAVSLSRTTLARREEQVNELRRSVGFYQAVLAENSRKNRLAIHSIRVESSGEGGQQFAFEVVLSRFLDAEGLVEGTVELTIRAKQDEARPDERAETVTVPFRLKHFQRVRGKINLPDDFSPAEILVQAAAQDRQRALHVQRVFTWRAVTAG